jgi:hypothetical protein
VIYNDGSGRRCTGKHKVQSGGNRLNPVEVMEVLSPRLFLVYGELDLIMYA